MADVPSNPPRPSRPPVPTVVQVADRLGDAVGAVCLTYLCLAQRISGEMALVGICALLGALQGLRAVGGRVNGAASALVVAGTAVGAAYLRARGIGLGVLSALVLGAVALAGCGATSQALNPRPVYGAHRLMMSDFGRCAFAGTWVGTAPGARALMTAHACVRTESGPAADAGVPADSAPPLAPPPQPPLAAPDAGDVE